jgi:hypothetical protein
MTTGEYTESRKNKRMTRATVELNAARTYVRQSRPADRDAGILLPRHMAGLSAIFGRSEAE